MSVSAIANHIDIVGTGPIRVKSGAIIAILLTAGSDLATLTLHDNLSSATGIRLAKIKARTDTSFVWQPSVPYRFENGLFVTVSGTGVAATVVHI